MITAKQAFLGSKQSTQDFLAHSGSDPLIKIHVDSKYEYMLTDIFSDTTLPYIDSVIRQVCQLGHQHAVFVLPTLLTGEPHEDLANDLLSKLKPLGYRAFIRKEPEGIYLMVLWIVENIEWQPQ